MLWGGRGRGCGRWLWWCAWGGVLPGDSAATGGSEGMQSRCLEQPPRIELGNGTTTVPQGGTHGLETAWRQLQTGVDRCRQVQTGADRCRLTATGRGLGASDTPSVPHVHALLSGCPPACSLCLVLLVLVLLCCSRYHHYHHFHYSTYYSHISLPSQ